MPKQKIDFRRGLSSTIPSEIVPGTILIETDTGSMYVDDTEMSRVQIKDSTKLPLTGGDLTGPLGLGGNVISNVGAPVADTDAVNKRYVDVELQTIESEFATSLQSYLQLKGGTMQGPLNMGGFSLTNLESPVNASDAATKQYVDSQISGAGQGDFLSNGSIPMTGNLQMNNHRITGVLTPTEDTDAVNKQYVDEHSSSGGADETIYTANGISIQPSNQPFNIGSSSGSAGDTGYKVNELYCNNGWFSSLNSESIDATSLSVSGLDFARKLSATEVLVIGNNDLTSTSSPNEVAITAKEGISLWLRSDGRDESLNFYYDTADGYEFIPGNSGTINIGSDTLTFASSYINTVYTQKLSPIPSSQNSILDLSDYSLMKFGNHTIIEVQSTTDMSHSYIDIGGASGERPDDKGFDYISLQSNTDIFLILGPAIGGSGLSLSLDSNSASLYPKLSINYPTFDLGNSARRYSTVYCESVSESSDAESKSDIHYLDSSNKIATRSAVQDSQITTQDVINFVKNLGPATFIYKRDGISTVGEAVSENPDIIHLGIIANDIENDPLFNYVASKVTSTVEDETEGEIEKTVYSIKPASLAVAALTACKYLLNKVEELENKLTA